MNTLLFVYGTLKRGCCNHAQMEGQVFVGPARTVPCYRLHDMGGFPGIAPAPDASEGVLGEVWSVDGEALRRLDAFEGVREGLYRRAPLSLQEPFAQQVVEAYLPLTPITHRAAVGAEWRE